MTDEETKDTRTAEERRADDDRVANEGAVETLRKRSAARAKLFKARGWDVDEEEENDVDEPDVDEPDVDEEEVNIENENSKTIRVGDLAGGDRVRFPGGPDGPDAVYTINKIQKPGHGDCYVEIGYPDGGRYRTAMHENEKAELVARGGAVNTLEAAIRHLFERPNPGTVLEHGEHALYCVPGYPGVFVSFEDTEAGAALCYELVLAQLRFDWDGQIRRFHVLPDEA